MSQTSSTRHPGWSPWIPVLLAALGLAAQGCAGETPTEPEGSLEDALGSLQVLLTGDSVNPEAAGGALDGFHPAADDPHTEQDPGLEEVHVWVTGLSTELAAGTRLTFNEDVGDVDLMALDGTTVEMVDVEIPTGTYLHVAFSLDAERSWVLEGGAQKPLSIPEEDVRVEGPFDVDPGARTSVTLHFDTEASLTRGDDGSWSLNPVVEIDITGG